MIKIHKLLTGIKIKMFVQSILFKIYKQLDHFFTLDFEFIENTKQNSMKNGRKKKQPHNF